MATWPEYLEAAMKRARIESNAELARRSGVNDSVISRWKSGVVPSLDKIRRVAEALNRPFLEVAVAAGAMTPEEARMTSPPALPEVPVGAGIDPDQLARLARFDREQIDAVIGLLESIKGER